MERFVVQPPHPRTDMKKKHFIFDVDDTLIDSYGLNQQLFVETFSSYLDLSNHEIKKYLRELHFRSRGTSMISQFQEAVTHFSLSVDPLKLVRQNEKLQIKNSKQVTLFDSVKELFIKLTSHGQKVSVCTNRPKESLLKILKSQGVQKYLTNIVSCHDAGHEKPDPFCLTKLIKESGEPKTNFIYFGDSVTDYQFAENAGIDFIIIDYYLNQKKFYKLIVESFI